ncbi:hypothetical protein [Methylocapsa sp. S129]|uniref:hypothetical protein n=1 Tax=Methylocapsa sp. S129 TaxID=1641869 RepID=UPI00131E4A20|nr:hypothetical protein [Methylocapsa sp. S129]
MTIQAAKTHFRDAEKIIAESIVDVATELRLTDVSDLMLFIRSDQAANIEDLVNSSTELYFKNGTLKYALAAGCSVRWDTSPTILLDMEFRHAAVSVFFRLVLSQSRAAVEVIDIFFDETGLDQELRVQRLTDAVADAKLPDPRTQLRSSAA